MALNALRINQLGTSTELAIGLGYATSVLSNGTWTHIDPNLIRFSQNTVSPTTTDGTPMPRFVQNMREGGYTYDPVDLVIMPDNGITTIDNRRITAAREAGITVNARVHAYGELLTTEEMARFTRANRDGYLEVPRTWGNAIQLRINSQKREFRTQTPYGSLAAPTINYRGPASGPPSPGLPPSPGANGGNSPSERTKRAEPTSPALSKDQVATMFDTMLLDEIAELNLSQMALLTAGQISGALSKMTAAQVVSILDKSVDANGTPQDADASFVFEELIDVATREIMLGLPPLSLTRSEKTFDNMWSHDNLSASDLYSMSWNQQRMLYCCGGLSGEDLERLFGIGGFEMNGGVNGNHPAIGVSTLRGMTPGQLQVVFACLLTPQDEQVLFDWIFSNLWSKNARELIPKIPVPEIANISPENLKKGVAYLTGEQLAYFNDEQLAACGIYLNDDEINNVGIGDAEKLTGFSTPTSMGAGNVFSLADYDALPSGIIFARGNTPSAIEFPPNAKLRVGPIYRFNGIDSPGGASYGAYITVVLEGHPDKVLAFPGAFPGDGETAPTSFWNWFRLERYWQGPEIIYNDERPMGVLVYSQLYREAAGERYDKVEIREGNAYGGVQVSGTELFRSVMGA